MSVSQILHILNTNSPTAHQSILCLMSLMKRDSQSTSSISKVTDNFTNEGCLVSYLLKWRTVSWSGRRSKIAFNNCRIGRMVWNSSSMKSSNTGTLVRLRLSELQRYWTQWVREKRDRRILNRGQEDPVHLEKGIRTPAQVLFMPKLGRIAATVLSAGELSFDGNLLFVKDL